MVQGLDHVAITIPAGSEDIARAFYGDTLGLQEIPKPEILAARGGVWYQLPDQRQLHLQSEAKFAPQTRAHPGFTADLDRLSQKVEAQWDDALAPRRRFYVTDPFGNRLEFIDPV